MPKTTLSLRPALLALPLLATTLLTGCLEKIPGMGPDPKAIAKLNEAKAVGSACRHAMRGIEDCYALNPKSAKDAVFLGWKEMDEYMREHKIEGTASVFTQSPPTAKTRTVSDEEIIESDSIRPRS